MKKTVFLVILTLVNVIADAQEPVSSTPAATSDDKMNVVVGVVMILLAGIFAYLIILDKKLKRIQKDS